MANVGEILARSGIGNLQDFLSGPERCTRDIVVDDLFAVAFDIAVQDWCVDLEHASLADWGSGLASAILDEPSVMTSAGSVVIVPARDRDGCARGVMAVDLGEGICPATVVGGYIGATLCVRDDMRGQGIGTALVVRRFTLDASLPCWHLDEASYSPAGQAAHARAWRMIQALAAPESIITEIEEGPSIG